MDSTSTLGRESSNKDDEGETQTPTSGGKRKETPPTSGASSQPIKVKRLLPTRSDVWEHYTRTPEDRDRCICNHCQNSFSCLTSSGTSNLKKHLETWKHFVEKTTLFTPLSRRTARKDIVKMYVARKEALKKWFISSQQRVSLTTDIWVSQTTVSYNLLITTTCASYMVVTVHFIDSSWRLKKLIIGFKHIMDHKGQTISTVLLDCLSEWGIDKVFCVTVDNATANSSALKKFQTTYAMGSDEAFVLDGEFLHMRCSAHIINLIVRDGMAEIDQNVVAIRNVISYVRSHTNRLRSFELKVDAGKITRGSLPLDVKTRWNSTYLMLTTAQKFKVAFDRMETEDKLYNDHFYELDNGVKRTGPPQPRDWNAVDKLCRFLMIFYNSTLVVSASTSLNSHKCYGEIVTIATNLRSLSTSHDPDLKSKATEMLKKFEKYWDGVKNINKMLIVATVFDPSNKLELAKMCFEELYGLNSVEYNDMLESLITLLRSLYKEYSARHGGGLHPNDQASQSSEQVQTQSRKPEY
ncbi:zinc finger BED domain-containing protein RICESLEEPER 2-like [Brassica rapa]|uniref:zinc finger BED domain-containing protein RICESLEEPER 2-like n=1 Tax=Brassica campestris TaxID=3711 RepID=UPI00142E6B12|nr:zinc finger BED domain-containing protein RICESLEEPER 2-like [Brassica rapa]